MRICSIKGLHIKLNNWFLVLVILFSFFGMAGKVISVFIAVLWHESAHALAAMGVGYRVREVELLPFGGVARIERLSEAGSASEFLIAAAGPLASLGLAAAIYFIVLLTGYWTEWLLFYFHTNLVLALFNLLPAIPLDGGRMLRAVLSVFWGYNKATTIAVTLSKIISIILLLIVVGECLLSGIVNLTFIIAAIFLYVTAQSELSLLGFRMMSRLARKKSDLMLQGVMPTNHFTAFQHTAVREVVNLFCMEQYCVVTVIDDAYHIKGALTETELWDGLPERGIYAKIGEFL